GATSPGASIIRSAADADFGNAITSRMLSVPARTIIIRSMPGAMPPWRSTELECVEEESETLASFFSRHSECFENKSLHVAAMNTNRSARHLDAVDHRVVSFRADLCEQVGFTAFDCTLK